MAESTLVKVERPNWQPPKNQMLNTFFNEHSQVMTALCTRPDMKADQVEKIVRGLLSMVSTEAERKSIEDKFDDDLKTIKNEKKQRKGIAELKPDDIDHCECVAYLKMLGRIFDSKNKYYFIEGNELCIAVLGEDGFDADFNPIKLFGPKKGEEILNKHGKTLRPELLEDKTLGDD